MDKEVKDMPVWKDIGFWAPTITGLVGTLVFTVFYYTGIEIDAAPIVGVVLGALGTWIGFNNHKDKEAHGDK